MNKNAIQRFAIWARTELISQVSQRAYQYDITADGYGEYDAEAVGGRLLSDDEKKQRQQLISQIRSKGYTQVMEEIAYTWFNRFIALRFMEVNNYLPTHIRVFSDASGTFKPEILSNALHLDLDGLDMEKVSDLIEKNQSEDLYRYLLLTQCNALSASLPRMFENMGSYTELLLPNNILRQDGVLGRMVTDIPEEDWTDQVQIIGWLYQYYNTELKDDTFALLKKNVKITKEHIPSATQLFTPDWIVRYMVENSLGRLWIEGHPDDDLKAGWKYYLDEAEQEADVQAQLETIRAEYRTLRPQDIKVIDPCMGSGHILVYAFEVLVQIYKKAGFSERDAAQSILKNNLYGLDIDDRAAQLAYFAVMMKARQYDRRIFSRNIQPHVYAIVESNDVHIPAKWRLGPAQNIAEKLVSELKNAKEYGSILNLSLTVDELTKLRKQLIEINELSSEGNLLDMIESSEIFGELYPLVEIAEMLAQKYDVVVTNPPYMGAGNMNPTLLDYIRKKYVEYSSDFFSAFIVRCTEFAKYNGKLGFLTPYVWMFILSYAKLRNLMLQNKTITSLLQFEYSAFEEAIVPICSFTFNNNKIYNYCASYVRLTAFRGGMEVQREKTLEAIRNPYCGYFYTSNSDAFLSVPDCPIAYWQKNSFLNTFKTLKPLGYYVDVRKGMTTSDNNVYIRFWWEVSLWNTNIRLVENVTWYKTHKGGEFRRWYGNDENLVNWADNGAALKSFPKSVIRNEEYYLRECISWNDISSAKAAFRYVPSGSISNASGPSFYGDKSIMMYLLGFTNSVVCENYLTMLCPTIHFEIGQIAKIPIYYKKEYEQSVLTIVKDSIDKSKEDWDSFETSWNFEVHPIVKKALSRFHWGHEGAITLEYVYKYVAQDFEQRFHRLKANEEELNHIFIDIYGLQDELTPEVEEKDVTVRRADLGRDIRSMISYAVGCMFGRYSLAQWGLAYAGGEGNPGGRGIADYGEFKPDKDNIIPICDDEYFDDDITGRFIKWVEVVFGKETLEENLK